MRKFASDFRAQISSDDSHKVQSSSSLPRVEYEISSHDINLHLFTHALCCEQPDGVSRGTRLSFSVHAGRNISCRNSRPRIKSHPSSFGLIAGWLGAASWAASMLSTPVIIALCRRKSTRLTAVIGGLVLALGILFASFATQLHQVAFSYGKSGLEGFQLLI